MIPIRKTYNGNDNLLRAGTQIEWTLEMLQEYQRCKEDPIYFAEKYFYIVTLDDGKQVIKLYDFQKEFILSCINNRRTIQCTSRQIGKTTSSTIVICHSVIFNESYSCGLLANNGAAAREIMSRIQMAYEMLPDFLKVGVREWNKGSFELENGSKCIASATSGSAARGKSFNCVTSSTKVCVLEEDSVFYTEIENIINKHRLIEIEDKNMLYTVYKVINKQNQKEYIGFHSVKNESCILMPESESGSLYKDGYMGSGKKIVLAIESLGPENFKQILLGVFDSKEEAENLERELVNKEYTLREDTYNIAEGGNVRIGYGKNNGFYGKKHNKETIDKIQKSRKKTLKDNPFSHSEFIINGQRFFKIEDGIKYLKIDAGTKALNMHEFRRYVYEGKVKFKSDFLQEKSIETYLQREEFLRTAEERKLKAREVLSKAVRGKPKTRAHAEKIGKSQSKWIKDNPEKHAARMEKINKNPEKIRKMAEKHRGMKRSKDTCKNISESLLGKVIAHNVALKMVSRFKNVDHIPDGWKRGSGKKVYNNGEVNIYLNSWDTIPEGFVLGRVK